MDIEEEPEVRRGPGRPRKDESTEAVVARAPIRSEVRERKRRSGSADRFHIPPEMIPPGVSVEWKAETVVGQPVDPWVVRDQYDAGWRPVDVSMMPDLMPKGYKGAIRQGGQILMERPIELTKEAQAEALQDARDAWRAKEQQLRGAASVFNEQRPGTGAKVSRSVQPGSIPE